MIKLALPVNVEDVDIRVRKFAVTFLCSSMISAFEEYKKIYSSTVKEEHTVVVDTFTVKVKEKDPNAAMTELQSIYKKNKNKFISKDKGVKALTILSAAFWVAWLGFTIFSAVVLSQQQPWELWLILAFAITFLGAVGFTIWLVYRRKQAGAYVQDRMERGLEQLKTIIQTIKDWREKYTAADEQSVLVTEALNKFITSDEEVSDNE